GMRVRLEKPDEKTGDAILALAAICVKSKVDRAVREGCSTLSRCMDRSFASSSEDPTRFLDARYLRSTGDAHSPKTILFPTEGDS
ncbi:MAG: hypothetical protein WCA91_15925, partial [Candidatus Acidiferrales bacterium]